MPTKKKPLKKEIKTKKEKSEKLVTRASGGGCQAPIMPDDFFEQNPGATWDSGDCLWRDSGGNPIGPG